VNVVETGGKVASELITSMRSAPLAIALLMVNIGFLAFATFLLGEVSANASERNKAQIELIGKLVTDIRDCRQGPSRSNNRSIMFKDYLR
jgi:hypothetical protein